MGFLTSEQEQDLLKEYPIPPVMLFANHNSV